jgi:hypothetical protein
MASFEVNTGVINFKVDVPETTKFIEECIARWSGSKSASKREAFVKDLLNRLSLDLDKKNIRLNILIFNLQQPCEQGLQGIKYYEGFDFDDTKYGVWFFESGTFVNLGQGTFQNWGMCGNFKHSGPTVKGGEMGRFVEFLKP